MYVLNFFSSSMQPLTKLCRMKGSRPYGFGRDQDDFILVLVLVLGNRRGDVSLTGSSVPEYRRLFFIRKSVITVTSKKGGMGT